MMTNSADESLGFFFFLNSHVMNKNGKAQRSRGAGKDTERARKKKETQKRHCFFFVLHLLSFIALMREYVQIIISGNL